MRIENLFITVISLMIVCDIFAKNGSNPDTIANNIVIYNTISIEKNITEKCYYIWSLDESLIKAFEMQIYNRWGQIVFETDKINKCWSGNQNGKSLDAGVYIYSVTVELFNSSDAKKSAVFDHNATISLVR
ncbi:MAG: gliding motility-associated C-terminal domain-containing protein [Bacteroidota bacterium]